MERQLMVLQLSEQNGIKTEYDSSVNDQQQRPHICIACYYGRHFNHPDFTCDDCLQHLVVRRMTKVVDNLYSS